MTTKGYFVFENTKGTVARVIRWESEQAYLIEVRDTHRIEIVSDLESLRRRNIHFTLLNTISKNEVLKSALTITNGVKIRWLKEIQNIDHSIEVPDEDPAKNLLIYKRVVGGYALALLLIILIGQFIEPWLFPNAKETVVTVVQQNRPPEKIPTVTPADKPIIQPVIPPRKKQLTVTRKFTPKSIHKTKVVVKKKSSQNSASLSQLGALGVLGGKSNGLRNSQGLNLNSTRRSRGTSLTQSGSAGAGGYSSTLIGQGLIARKQGANNQILGGGGYHTRGTGGGAPGYGRMNIGGAEGFFEPLPEEALIQGGLDRDQISAVINKHMGQIIYCYEKGLQTNQHLAGRVTVDFTISGQGAVSRAAILTSSLNSSQIESCVVQRLRTWKFPKPIGNVNVKVNYPFLFKRRIYEAHL